MIAIYQELEDYIMQDIADRLLKVETVAGTTDRLLWKLQQMGESRSSILQKLSRITGLSRRELKALLQDAVITSWEDDLSTFNQVGIEIRNPLENPAVMSVMDAEYRKSQGELKNLTRTTMNQAVSDLVRMLDEVEIRVASGVQSYTSAICEILDNYAEKGIMIEYPGGTKRTLEAAVRACVVTSMNQTSAQITNQYIVEGGAEYVLVSAHKGARIQQPGQPYLAGHENWQGKVFRIRGSEPDYPNLEESTGYGIDSLGNGYNENMLGLHGYNCRHSHQAWFPGMDNPYVDEDGNPVIDSEESRETYRKQQKQRAMERAIRKTKRELLMKQMEIDGVAETDVREVLQGSYDKLAYKLRRQNAAYREFCEKNGMRHQAARLKVAGFKRAQAAKASGRARAYERWAEKTEETKGALNKKNDPLGKKRDLHAKKYYAELENRNKNAVVRKIAENSGMGEKTVKSVYEHVIEQEHLFRDGGKRKFSPDYDMAQSFQRLIGGKGIKPHDMTLLRHERLEYLLMKKYNMVYEDAHEIAAGKYDYAAELNEFLRRDS